MTADELVESLRAMLSEAQAIALAHEPSMEGDIQIILAILTDKLRCLDPQGVYPRLVNYE
ncbi:MAG: hypothetical protein IT318_00865 [Anaerolineales bacterium]|nr:hypothetical protein [Anaerolineales bacterium]